MRTRLKLCSPNDYILVKPLHRPDTLGQQCFISRDPAGPSALTARDQDGPLCEAVVAASSETEGRSRSACGSTGIAGVLGAGTRLP